ncbi:MAG: sugar kinase [Rhodoferax sp.]|uniref:sugar kinase n=1 Tax=Rhodoferax sp. TaxID=50421 RepID=UPI001B5299EF|nr:sugar kinase [Rhodoferax sp.]MBP9907699.1 sugar kinase [Rhodoferax sp.]
MKAMFDLVALGEAMVEFNQIPQGDGRMYLQGFGGDTSNTSIAAARQGARCAYISMVGNDALGDMCLELWRTEGVDVSAVQVRPDAPTGVYFVRHDADGHHFSYLRKGSAASLIRPEHLSAALLGNTQYLHVSGISQAISVSARETIAAAIAMACAAGVRVSYDPNLRFALWSLDDARLAIIATLASTDEFLPGLDELALVSGLQQPDAIVNWAHQHGAKHVVLKMGVKGVLASNGQSMQKIDAFAVKALDATGAGDCFNGAYLARRARGEDVFASARWAVASAALSTQGYGAVAPLPTEARVAEFLATRVELS